jgi:hypothetical protein
MDTIWDYKETVHQLFVDFKKTYFQLEGKYCTVWPRHSSSGQSLDPHGGGPGSNPGLVMWDLCWTKWRWGRFSPSTSVSPANLYSINFSTITITYLLGLVQ